MRSGAVSVGRLFRAVYTGTRPWVTPAIRAGKGWRGRRELAPRCSATQLGACSCGDMDRHIVVIPSSEPPPPPRVFLKRCCRFGGLKKRPSGRHKRTRLRSAETGATAALDASARAADRRIGVGGGPASQPSCGPCTTRRLAGTEDSQLGWCAAGRPRGARPAGASSRDKLRACRGALLAQPVLGGDILDAAAVQFLLAKTLLQRQREEKQQEHEKLMWGVADRLRHGLPVTEAERQAWRQ